MGDLALRQERFSDSIEEALSFLQRQAREINAFGLPLAIDYAAYKRLEDADLLRCYSARIDGKLAGYASFTLSTSLHYAGTIFASQDLFYIVPEHRGGMTALALLRYVERRLADDGAEVIVQHASGVHPAFGRLLELNGYTPFEASAFKRLNVHAEV